MSVLFDIVYKNKISGNSLSAFLKLNFIAPVVLICTRSEVFTNSISDSDYWEIFIIYMYTRIVKALQEETFANIRVNYFLLCY